jgi:protein-S-isoprenylcysteine O-methyltransferase Ste14
VELPLETAGKKFAIVVRAGDDLKADAAVDRGGQRVSPTDALTIQLSPNVSVVSCSLIRSLTRSRLAMAQRSTRRQPSKQLFQSGQIVVVPFILGVLDSVRISNVARYSGPSFSPTMGDLANEPGTLLLYNFNANEVSGNTVYDQSGNGRNGTFASGFDGATAPTLVPEPSTLVLLGVGALGLLAWAWRRRKQISV